MGMQAGSSASSARGKEFVSRHFTAPCAPQQASNAKRATTPTPQPSSLKSRPAALSLWTTASGGQSSRMPRKASACGTAPDSPCLTATLSEGLAELTAVSCCSMSAKWQSTASPSSRSPAASSFSGKFSSTGLSGPGQRKTRAWRHDQAAGL